MFLLKNCTGASEGRGRFCVNNVDRCLRGNDSAILFRTLRNDRAFSEVNYHKWQSIGGVRELSHVGNGDRYAREMETNLDLTSNNNPIYDEIDIQLSETRR